jgi:uncharacterized protein
VDLKEVISKIEPLVKEALKSDSSGHDWWHIHRVKNLALHIGKKENANLTIVHLAALLHDIADWKLGPDNENQGILKVKIWLESLKINIQDIDHICEIIQTLSFKGAHVATPMHSIEGKVVQDADRLDAIGAIGIARAFAYGGSRGREMYNPYIQPSLHTSFHNYKQNQSTTINHFYEKLLLLQDSLNTQTAIQIANKRHKYLLRFLKQFLNEWNEYNEK